MNEQKVLVTALQYRGKLQKQLLEQNKYTFKT